MFTRRSKVPKSSAGASEHDGELEQLIDKYTGIRKEIEDLWNDELLDFGVWRFKVVRPVTSRFASNMFTVFFISTFLTGTGLIFVPVENAAELGIAMVVGSIFALGAFLTQWWAVGVQRNFAKRDLVLGEQYRQRMLELYTQHRELADRINQFAGTVDSTVGSSPRSGDGRIRTGDS